MSNTGLTKLLHPKIQQWYLQWLGFMDKIHHFARKAVYRSVPSHVLGMFRVSPLLAKGFRGFWCTKWSFLSIPFLAGGAEGLCTWSRQEPAEGALQRTAHTEHAAPFQNSLHPWIPSILQRTAHTAPSLASLHSWIPSIPPSSEDSSHCPIPRFPAENPGFLHPAHAQPSPRRIPSSVLSLLLLCAPELALTLLSLQQNFALYQPFNRYLIHPVL